MDNTIMSYATGRAARNVTESMINNTIDLGDESFRRIVTEEEDVHKLSVDLKQLRDG